MIIISHTTLDRIFTWYHVKMIPDTFEFIMPVFMSTIYCKLVTPYRLKTFEKNR